MSFVHTTIMKKRQCLLFMRAVQSAMWWSLGSRKSYLPCKYACYKSRAIREVAVAPGFHVGPSSVGPSVRQLLGSPRQHAIQPSHHPLPYNYLASEIMQKLQHWCSFNPPSKYTVHLLCRGCLCWLGKAKKYFFKCLI